MGGVEHDADPRGNQAGKHPGEARRRIRQQRGDRPALRHHCRHKTRNAQDTAEQIRVGQLLRRADDGDGVGIASGDIAQQGEDAALREVRRGRDAAAIGWAGPFRSNGTPSGQVQTISCEAMSSGKGISGSAPRVARVEADGSNIKHGRRHLRTFERVDLTTARLRSPVIARTVATWQFRSAYALTIPTGIAASLRFSQSGGGDCGSSLG